MIKDFDTFEANLVMSTLSPEDTEYECQQSRTVAQSNLQNTTTDNIVLDRTNVDGDEDAAAAVTDANKESTSHEDEEPNNGIANAKKRNRLLASASDSFESSISKRASLDIVLRTKKRRTSNEHRRDTHIPSVNGSQAMNQMETSPPAPPPPQNVDLESENIDVVFQDDSPDPNNSLHFGNGIDSMDVDMESSERNARDHRPFVRQVFELCFTGNTPRNSDVFGKILCNGSDEEEQ